MEDYEEKLKKFMQESNVQGEHLHFEGSVHTVEDACMEAKAQPDDLIKTICMMTNEGKVIGALVLGSDRVSTESVAKALKIERPHIATSEEAERMGYLLGGMPPFGYEAIFLIDPKIMEKNTVYVGGGTPNALVRITTKEIQRVNQGMVVRIRK
ncbi:MAG: Cys-tRNA(Pro)/Cys-tRNA(Cys) deacylase [Thermoproteota archaeon]|nr:Cys-tRNA(Pro)/Cys-tRNA(Cys) deacylase [Thermoproteota archaeon]